MKPFRHLSRAVPALFLANALAAQTAAPAAPAPAVAPPRPAITTEATDLLERFVSWLHHFTPDIDDALFHWIACGVVVVLAILLRHVITNIIFHYLKKLAAKTETTLDDKLFPAMEAPVSALLLVLGVFAALTVLQLSPQVDHLINNGTTIALLGVIIWGFIRGGGAVVDHLEEIAHARQLTVATFMPLIKKILLVVVIIVGALVIAQSMGWPVGTLLGGAAISGLAVALAAQEALANLFASFVVVIDQPFKVGDVVKVGSAEGKVEDIGLRSTKIRTAARTLIVIPNKTVAGEAITNYSRMPQRRVDQTLGLTYDATAEQLEGILEDLRRILREDPGVHADSIAVNFANYGESSLDIQIVYFTADPDWGRHMALRERLNLKFMRAVTARGLSFAFPTQTMHLPEPLVAKLALPKT